MRHLRKDFPSYIQTAQFGCCCGENYSWVVLGVQLKARATSIVKGCPPCSMPSRSERENHRLTHILYRPWCKFCVEGKGVNKSHGKNACKDQPMTVSIDYTWMHEGKTEWTEEEEDGIIKRKES